MKKHRIKDWLRLLWPFTALYEYANTQREYYYTLNVFVIGTMLGSFFSMCTGGVALVGYAKALGISDFLFGIITAIPTACMLMSFVASWVLEKTRNRKAIQLWAFFPARFMWLLIAMIPFIVPMEQTGLRVMMFVVLYTAISLFSQMGGAAGNTWLFDMLPPSIQGRYFSYRSLFATAVNIVASFAVSAFLDAMSNTMTAYTISFLIGAIIGIADITTFIWTKDPPMKPMHTSYIKGMAKALKSKPFLKMMLFWTLWNFAYHSSFAYYGRYMTVGDGMNMSMKLFSVISQVLVGIVVVLVLPWWGKWLDRNGRNWVLKHSIWFLAAVPMLWLFARPGNILVPLIYFVLFAATSCGVDLSATHMAVRVFPAQSRSVYLAIYTTVSSLAGTVLGNLCGGWFLSLIGERQFQFLGFALNRYQLLFLASGVMRLIVLCLFFGMLTKIKNREDDPAAQAEDEQAALATQVPAAASGKG